MEFTQEQLAAIRHGKGPALVTAGPGAGKTAVLTARVRRLLEDDPKGRVLVISFTVSASLELEKRLFGNGNAPKNVFIGTFHSFFLRMLRVTGILDGVKLVRREDALSALEEYFEKLGPNAAEEAEQWLDDYDRTRNKGRTFEGPAFSCEGGTEACDPEARTVYERYKAENGLIDYEDMQTLLLRHLREKPALADYCAGLYEYVLVDEFQDVNPLQFELLRYFLGPSRNLFAVGDEDQAIYAFRGSDPTLTVRFEDFFPGSAHYTLYRNFRSGSEIVDASSAFIAHNLARYPKELVSDRGPGSKIRFVLCRRPAGELERLRDTLLEWHAEGCLYEEMAVLYRTHSQNRAVAASLSQAGIPFRSPEKEGVPADHKVVKLLESFILTANGSADPDAFETVCRYFAVPDHLIRESLRNPDGAMSALANHPALTLAEREKTEETVGLLRQIAGKPLPEALRHLWHFGGVADYAERFRQERHLDTDSQNSLFTHVFRIAEEAADADEWSGLLRRPFGGGVTLSTVHAAKGLEYRKVWVEGVCKGIFPHPRSVSEDGLEEERRILYVAMTRARDELCVSGYALGRVNRSAFWEELC